MKEICETEKGEGEEKEKSYKTFRRFLVFGFHVFSYSAKNENTELVEIFWKNVVSQFKLH